MSGLVRVNSFFSMDGAFIRVIGLLADVVILSVIWLVLSVPSVFIFSGAATTAMYFAVTKRIVNRETYLMRDFWGSFKQNFVQATCSWLAMGLAGFILFAARRFFGEFGPFLMPLEMLAGLELLFLAVYVFPLIARFKLSFPQAFKNAFLLSNRHLPTSVLCLALAASAAVLSMRFFVFIFFAVGAYVLLSSYLLVRVFKLYRSDLDADDAPQTPPAPDEAPRDQIWQTLQETPGSLKISESLESPADGGKGHE